MSKKTEVLDHRCPSCGAKIVFDAKSNNWKCDYCGSSFTLEELQKYENASNKKKNVSSNTVDDYDNYMIYNCPDCGAEIITDEQTTATFCVYCGNTAILRNKLSGKFTPSKIIPFKKTKQNAEEAFLKLSKGRPLVPKEFTKKENIEKIRGIYIPFWFHTFKVAGEVNYLGKDISQWVVGDTHFTKTDSYDVIRKGSLIFRSVPVDGSTRFANDLMNSIQPYDYNDLVVYNHAYLSGFLAERYDVEGNDTRSEVEEDVLNEAKNVFMHDSKYDSKVIKSNTLQTSEYDILYVLLPVYMVNVKYGGKFYTFAMNGQTGKFIGNIPVDKKKAFFISIILFVILFLVIWGITYIVFMAGGR